MKVHGYTSILTGLTLVVCMSSCLKKIETRNDQDVFYMEDLINNQIVYLSSHNYGIRKITRLGEREEITENYPDSLEWTKEFNILKDADISKPGLRPFYDIRSYETPMYRIDHYVLKDSGKSNTLYQKVFRDIKSGKLLRLLTEQYVQNPIYHSERRIELVFATIHGNTVIDSITVTGYQKMIARDTAYYSLMARMIP